MIFGYQGPVLGGDVLSQHLHLPHTKPVRLKCIIDSIRFCQTGVGVIPQALGSFLKSSEEWTFRFLSFKI